MMRKTFSALCAFVFVFGLAVNARAGEPQARLKIGVDRAIAVLSDRSLKAPAKRHSREAKLRAVADGFFDWRELSRRAVGRYWNRYTPKQQNEFIASFSTLLEKTYFRKLEKYNNEKVRYLREQISGNRAFITTEVVMHDRSVPINYVMIKHQQWMVYDVVIEGVSLVKNYRSQFQRILSRESPESLLKRIRDKIAALDSGKNVGDAIGGKEG